MCIRDSYFTDEQKLRANSVDLERYLLQNGEELIRSGPEKRLKSDKSITIRGSEWFDHAQAVKTGGGPVAFVMYHYGLSYPEAMIRLLGGEQGVVYEASPRKEEPEPKEFALPPAGESMRRVYAYLLKQRFISREVLNTFVSQRLIYESCEKSKDNTKEYHNAVFVGFDEHGVPRHAHKRGVYTHGKSYRGNVSGCDPRYSFHWTGSSDRLYVDVYKRQTSRPAVRYPRPVYWGQGLAGTLSGSGGSGGTSRQRLAAYHFPAAGGRITPGL